MPSRKRTSLHLHQMTCTAGLLMFINNGEQEWNYVIACFFLYFFVQILSVTHTSYVNSILLEFSHLLLFFFLSEFPWSLHSHSHLPSVSPLSPSFLFSLLSFRLSCSVSSPQFSVRPLPLCCSSSFYPQFPPSLSFVTSSCALSPNCIIFPTSSVTPFFPSLTFHIATPHFLRSPCPRQPTFPHPPFFRITPSLVSLPSHHFRVPPLYVSLFRSCTSDLVIQLMTKQQFVQRLCFMLLMVLTQLPVSIVVASD